MPLMSFVGSYLGMGFVTRYGYRPLAAITSFFLAAGNLILVFTVSGGGAYWAIFIGLFVFGSGLGLGTVAGAGAALSRISKSDAGLASGVNAGALQVGGGFGVAIVTTAIASSAHGANPLAAATHGFRGGFEACITFGVAGVIIALALISGKRKGEEVALPAAQLH
jgi:MFS family permease